LAFHERVSRISYVRRPAAIFGTIILLHGVAAQAQSRSNEAAPDPPSSPTAQTIYKGVLGNLLEAVPLDPKERVQLQQLNAVVGSPLSGHSLAMALGIASPPLIVIGLLWGLWSAKQIQPKETLVEQAPRTQQASNAAEFSQGEAARRDRAAIAALQTTRASDVPMPNRQAVERLAAAAQEIPPDRSFAVDRITGFLDASALAAVVGSGATSTDRAVPCESCYMPILYPRAAPDVR
jgi:hypothetical protein